MEIVLLIKILFVGLVGILVTFAIVRIIQDARKETAEFLARRDVLQKQILEIELFQSLMEGNFQKAQQFTNCLLKHYNIQSSLQPGPKLIKSKNGVHTVLLTQKQFEKTKGHFKNLK